MNATLSYANNMLTITADNGDVVVRNTKAEYKAAIVGRNSKGKLCVVFASADVAKVKSTFGSIESAPVGSVTYCKFNGFSELTFVTAEKASDEWVPVADPDAWKAADAALIAKKK